MKLKQRLLFVITLLLMTLSANSQAGRQGISFYYGLGLGVVAPSDVDVGAAGDIIIGFEEDGWAIEGSAFSSASAGTNDSTVDYTVNGTQFGLAYRTIETNNRWFKYKISNTNMDFDFSDNTATATSSGIGYTLGIGLRMSRERRAELDYTYYDSSDLADVVHILTLRVFWGGSEYQGREF